MKRFTIALAAASVLALPALAADLGGNCCADLEERIAELEATAARKGERKMTLTIYGQLNKALLWHDIEGLPGEGKLRNVDNSNSGSRFGFMGSAKIAADMKAGFHYEFGIDETRGKLLGDMFASDDILLRHANVWLETRLGKLTIGQGSGATDGIVEITTANTLVTSLPLSLEPMWTYAGAPSIGGVSLNPTPFDGGRGQIVRYDSPVFGGFYASASYGGGQTAAGDDMWEVALRYSGEISGIRLAAGAGYRVEKWDGLAAETKTIAGSASAMHMATGLFMTVSAGQTKDNFIFGDMTMWQAQAGVERNWFGYGATTLYVEYGDHKLDGAGIDSSLYGAGIVQRLDAAAMDVYLSFRSYDIGGYDANVVMGGARIKF